MEGHRRTRETYVETRHLPCENRVHMVVWASSLGLETKEPEIVDSDPSDDEEDGEGNGKKRRRNRSTWAKPLPKWTQQPVRHFSSATPDPG